MANVNFYDPEKRAQFREQQDALYTERKAAIVAELKSNGDLDENGQWVFKKPLPEDKGGDCG